MRIDQFVPVVGKSIKGGIGSERQKMGRIFLCDVRCERQFRQRVNLNKEGHGDGSPDV